MSLQADSQINPQKSSSDQEESKTAKPGKLIRKHNSP